MTDLEVHGEIRCSTRPGVPDHSFTAEGRVVVVSAGRVSVRWSKAPDDSDDPQRAIGSWFEMYLMAASVQAGAAIYVHWDGMTVHLPGGRSRVGKSMSLRWDYVREHPEPFDRYAQLATSIADRVEVLAAAEHMRTAMDLVSQDLGISAGAAYRAVELLAGSQLLREWQSLGRKLESAGLGKTSDDLETLYVSMQQYRHESRIRPDKVEGRALLDYRGCCREAAEVLEAYCEGVRAGTIQGRSRIAGTTLRRADLRSRGDF